MKKLISIIILLVGLIGLSQTHNLTINGNYLTIKNIADSNTKNYSRHYVSIEEQGDYVYFGLRDEVKDYKFKYTDVTYDDSLTFSSKSEFLSWCYSSTGGKQNYSYPYEIGSGNVFGAGVINKFGYNTDVDTGGEEIIGSFGGVFDPVVNVMTTAQTFTITYNNSTDGVATSGALSLLVTYIDSNYNEVIGIHTLGNTGSEVTAFTGYGINRVVVLTNGGLGYNGSDITITATIDTTIQAQLPASSSVTEQCLYHTGIGKNVMLDFLKISATKLSGGSSPTVTIRGYSWSRVTLTRYEVFNTEIDTSIDNHLIISSTQPLVLGGREVFYFTAETSVNNTVVRLRFSGIQN